MYDCRDSLTSEICVYVSRDPHNDVTMSSAYERSQVDVAPNSNENTLRRRRANDKKGQASDKKAATSATHLNVRNSFIAIPSSELREAIRCFRLAVHRAVEVVNVNIKLGSALDKEQA